MEQNITKINIPELIRLAPKARSYNDDVIIIEMSDNDKYRIPFDKEHRLQIDNALFMFLVVEGSMDINIDGIEFHLPENSQIGIVHIQTFRNIRLSTPFKGYNINVSKKCLEKIWSDSKQIPISVFMSHRETPVLRLQKEEMKQLEDLTLRIRRNMDRPTHLFYGNLVINELRSFFMEFGNIMVQRYPTNLEPDTQKDRIIISFVHLLHEHCKTEHSVTFYARQLCITPEYLSKILKHFSGRTVTKWIDDALLREAQILIRNKTLTIQQISDALNFSDQSAFGKFFKKHIGMSPVEYRKQY